MFKANKNLMNVFSAIVRDDSNAFHAKMFKELRKIDEEMNQRGLFYSGGRIQAYRDFYHKDGKEFVVGLVEKIEQLQKEQEILYTDKDWHAIEEEMFRVCDDLYRHYINLDDEVRRRMGWTPVKFGLL